MDSRPWDYQAEECSLRSAVDRFNHRRYQRELPNIQGQQQQTSQQMQQSQEKSIENQVFGQEVRTIGTIIFLSGKIFKGYVGARLG